MWKQKIGISVGSEYNKPITDVVKMIKKTGFDAISPEWENRNDLENILTTAKECGLAIQSIHGPFHHAADIWSEDENVYSPALNEMLEALKFCKDYNIPVMVVHTWIGFGYTFCGENLNFKNFDLLVETATEYGVKIAFENTEGEEYLFELMERYKNNETVGYCWDSGHEMCYNKSQDLLAKFGDRLYMTHINDNLGVSRFDGEIFWTDDLHLLPYDGIADWDYNIQRLKNSRPLEFLNFELNIHSKPDRHENDIYASMPLELYFAEAYKRACRIAYKYSI